MQSAHAIAAKEAAVLEERNRLAGEIHDSFTQLFAGIALQLAVAEEEMVAGEGAPLCRLRLANELAEFGLAEARRAAFSLRSTVIEEFGLVEALQMLVERSNVAGRLRCNFRSNSISEEKLSPRLQHELLRIAQEAIGNAIRHGQPTVITVTLRWTPPHLILQIKDNGCGIPNTRLEKSEGIGLRSMRERAAQIDAKLAIQTDCGHGTRIIVTASRNYTGGFAIDLMLKDLGLATDAAKLARQPVYLGALAQQLYQAMSTKGAGRLDFSSVIKLYVPTQVP